MDPSRHGGSARWVEPSRILQGGDLRFRNEVFRGALKFRPVGVRHPAPEENPSPYGKAPEDHRVDEGRPDGVGFGKVRGRVVDVDHAEAPVREGAISVLLPKGDKMLRKVEEIE